MLAHAFSHDSAAYQVSFTRMDGQWFATLSRSDRALSRALPAFIDEGLGPFSDGATRAGYVALAEWLVKTSDWPDTGDDALPQEPVPAPVDREKAAPCIERPAQEQIGRELQAYYADLLDEPVPDTLLALLGTVAPPAEQQRGRNALMTATAQISSAASENDGSSSVGCADTDPVISGSCASAALAEQRASSLHDAR